MSKPRLRMGEMALPEDPETVEQFEALLAYLKQSRGFDFTAYKRSSLMRRVLVRMQMIDVKDFAAYLDFLQVDAEEFTRLFNTILINVTSFFRDPPTWDHLRDELLPRLQQVLSPRQLRRWAGGGSSCGASPRPDHIRWCCAARPARHCRRCR